MTQCALPAYRRAGADTCRPTLFGGGSFAFYRILFYYEYYNSLQSLTGFPGLLSLLL